MKIRFIPCLSLTSDHPLCLSSSSETGNVPLMVFGDPVELVIYQKLIDSFEQNIRTYRWN